MLLLLIVGGGAGGAAPGVFSASANGREHSVWGLAYAGFFGAALLWLELLAVIAATVLTALPGQVLPAALHQRLRRLGHGFLIGWAGLWMIGAISMSAIDPGLRTFQAIFIAGLFGCTVYRAVRHWNRQADVPSPVELAPLAQVEPAVSLRDFSPHTDLVPDGRTLLQRSAVRPSNRLREVDRVAAECATSTPAAPPPLRLFSAHEDDDVDVQSSPRHLKQACKKAAAATMAATRNALQFMRTQASRLSSALESLIPAYRHGR